MVGKNTSILRDKRTCPSQEDDEMVVHSSTQHPTEVQHKVAEALGVQFHNVRVEVRRMGGGFGGKESQGNALAMACAIAAHRTNKPCKMRYDRDDDMLITGKRHDFRITYRAGVDQHNKIIALDVVHYARCGGRRIYLCPLPIAQCCTQITHISCPMSVLKATA